jgi:hypothetical protein
MLACKLAVVVATAAAAAAAKAGPAKAAVVVVHSPLACLYCLLSLFQCLCSSTTGKQMNMYLVLMSYVLCHYCCRLCMAVINLLKTLAKLASSSVFSLAKSENNWPKILKR